MGKRIKSKVSIPYHEFLKAKGADRIQINNLLGAISLGAVSFLVGVSSGRINPWILGQMAIAVPCLVASSLAYSKIVYRPSKETHVWDTFGWLTHSIGYIFLLNSIALMIRAAGYFELSLGFIAVTIFLFVLYSALDVFLGFHRLREKVFKLVFYLLFIVSGSLFPVLRN